MTIIIKNRSDEPIYSQIKLQIREQLTNGSIAEGEQLPSVRQLAKDLRISVITTAKAYTELADEGYIVSVQGKGYFAAEQGNELLRERMLCEMENALEKAADNGRKAGLSDDDIVAALKSIMEESYGKCASDK